MIENQKKALAIVPGSFDPITYGHIALAKEALRRYERVVVAVMINSAKQYLFTMEERVAIAKAALSDYPCIEVISSDGMLWKLAEDLGADGIVKGYRNEQDLAYEQEMAAFNLAHNPNAPTDLLPSPTELATISSTVVRERMQNGESLEGYLPEAAIAVIQKIKSARPLF